MGEHKPLILINFSTGGRLDSVDAAKAIAIIAIVIGHTICIDEIPYVHAAINSFHVPAFFIIAGFFVRSMELKDAVRKYAGQYLWPYLVTCVLICVVGLARALFKENGAVGAWLSEVSVAALWGSGLQTNVVWGDLPAIGAIWFLLALFWAKSLVSLSLRKLTMLEAVCMMAIVYCTGVVTSSYISLPWSILPGFEAALLVMVGYLIRKYELLEKAYALKWYVWVALVAVCVGNIALNDYISMVRGYMGANVVGVFCSVVETVGIICLCQRFKIRMAWTGANTLYILSAHLVTMPFSQKIYWKVLPQEQPVGLMFIEIVVINLIMAYALAWVMRRYSVLRCPWGAK